jgi:hypothetical protein
MSSAERTEQQTSRVMVAERLCCVASSTEISKAGSLEFQWLLKVLLKDRPG